MPYYTSKSFWLTGDKYPGSVYLYAEDLQKSPISQSTAATSTTWTVGKTASGSYCSMTGSATATMPSGGGIQPSDPLSTTIGEGWILGPFSGVFIGPQTMYFRLNVYATTISTQAGRIRFRLWRASDTSGGGAQLLTPTYSTNTIKVNASLTGSVTASVPITASLPLGNEYIYIETAWAVTGAGGSNGANVVIRDGSGSWFKTGPYESNTYISMLTDNGPGYSW